MYHVRGNVVQIRSLEQDTTGQEAIVGNLMKVQNCIM